MIGVIDEIDVYVKIRKEIIVLPLVKYLTLLLASFMIQHFGTPHNPKKNIAMLDRMDLKATLGSIFVAIQGCSHCWYGTFIICMSLLFSAYECWCMAAPIFMDM